jgi:putative ABC transport system permease protein
LPKPPDGQLRSGHVRPITPSFFKTLSIPQIAGRDFNDADTAASLPVAIVSASLVREFYTDGDPIGRRLRVNISHVDATREVEWTIVGVVDNIKSALDGPVRQTIYVPMAQTGGRSMRFFLNTPQDPTALATTVAGVLHQMESEAPVEISTLAELVGSSIARPRATSVLVGAFAILALLLAAVGVYGVMAYSVRERTQEIGIRMALGANAMSVFRLVIGQAIRLVLIGVAVGLVAAAALTRMLERLLFEVEPIEPWTFAATALILLLVATIASYVPARRGMRMAPVDALRTN